MLKKRLIGVVTVKEGLAVQSFGYSRYLPIGAPEVLVENLDRWGADEILVQNIDRSTNSLGPNLELLERIRQCGNGTPLIYAGGIACEQNAVDAIQAGADRICIDSLLHESMGMAERISGRLGAQAVIASLPFSKGKAGVEWSNYRSQVKKAIDGELLGILRDRVFSEFLVIDWKHEGSRAAFDIDLLKPFQDENVSIIAFGGLSEPSQLKQVLGMPCVSAVAVGNFLAYTEHALQSYKERLAELPLRAAYYKRENYNQ